MAGHVSLLLVYEANGGHPFTIARVEDRRMLLDAAQVAIIAAEHRAAELAVADCVLGEVERAEAGRLRKVLSLLVPELRFNEVARPAGAGVQ
jgi:hypothetical protein